MIPIVVSNNSELLRHLASSALRRTNLEVIVVSTGDEAIEAAREHRPRLVILDVELPERSGFETVQAIKQEHDSVRTILILGRRITARDMARVVASSCDEVLIAPMAVSELYDAIADQLDLPRRGADRHRIDLGVITSDGDREIDGRATNLSTEGARLILPEPMGEGTHVRMTITADEDLGQEPIRLSGRIVWARSREDSTVAGVVFENLDDAARTQLSRLTKWEVFEDLEGTRVMIRGDVTEGSSFDELAASLKGRVDFDLSQVSYINAQGAHIWANFVTMLDHLDYELHACSIAFVLQAGLSRELVGKGKIESFFAPYVCCDCGFEEERLLQSDSVACDARGEPVAPVFSCPACADGEMFLDDVPQRYLAFLSSDRRHVAS